MVLRVRQHLKDHYMTIQKSIWHKAFLTSQRQSPTRGQDRSGVVHSQQISCNPNADNCISVTTRFSHLTLAEDIRAIKSDF